MQTKVNSEMQKLHAGMLADIGNNDIVSYVNNSAQLVVVEVTQQDNFTYDITINGTLFSYTSAPSGDTADAIAAALQGAIAGGSEPVTANAIGGGTGQLYIVSNSTTVSFTITVGTNLTSTPLVSFEQAIPFGRFVAQDSQGQDYCRLPFVSTDVDGLGALGIAVHSHAIEQAYDTDDNTGYEFQSSISVLRKGRVFVDVETNVAPGDAVYVRHSVSGVTYLGAFRNDADSGTATQLAGARFVSSGTAGETAIVEVNLP